MKTELKNVVSDPTRNNGTGKTRNKKEGTQIKTKGHKSFLLPDCTTDMEGKGEMPEFH